MVGPNHDTAPLCLSCFKLVTGEFVCPDCELPLCDQTCADGEHKIWECKIFANKKKSIRISNFDSGSYHPFYQCITALR